MSDLDNVQFFVEAYNRAESERVGYGFKSQWVVESDESLATAVAEAEARGYQRAIDALRQLSGEERVMSDDIEQTGRVIRAVKAEALADAAGRLTAEAPARLAATPDAEPAPDWTVDPETGRSNSSAAFLRMCGEVERLIVSDAHKLIADRAYDTPRLILANLAHKHGLAPGVPVDTEATP